MKFKSPIDIVWTDKRLCLKHLREHLEIYDHYPDRKYEPTFKLIIDNENCKVCQKKAEDAYYSKLMEER